MIEPEIAEEASDDLTIALSELGWFGRFRVFLAGFLMALWLAVLPSGYTDALFGALPSAEFSVDDPDDEPVDEGA